MSPFVSPSPANPAVEPKRSGLMIRVSRDQSAPASARPRRPEDTRARGPSVPEGRCRSGPMHPKNDHGSNPSKPESTPKRGITASYESAYLQVVSFHVVSESGITIRSVSAPDEGVAHDPRPVGSLRIHYENPRDSARIDAVLLTVSRAGIVRFPGRNCFPDWRADRLPCRRSGLRVAARRP
jgi:hypothetical protein